MCRGRTESARLESPGDVHRNLGIGRGGAGSSTLGSCRHKRQLNATGVGDITQGVWRKRRQTGLRPGFNVSDILGLTVKRCQEALCLPPGKPRQEVASGHQEVT